MGAGKPERARQTLRYAICITFSFGLIIAIAMQFAAGAAVSSLLMRQRLSGSEPSI
ncbi:MAG: hypothetical protein ACLR8P_05755 [Clostridium fessum]